jgi:large-conductance mechanosensitive channel
MAIIGYLIIGVIVFFIVKFMWGLYKICPYCRESIAFNATKCPKCTKDL